MKCSFYSCAQDSSKEIPEDVNVSIIKIIDMKILRGCNELSCRMLVLVVFLSDNGCFRFEITCTFNSYVPTLLSTQCLSPCIVNVCKCWFSRMASPVHSDGKTIRCLWAQHVNHFVHQCTPLRSQTEPTGLWFATVHQMSCATSFYLTLSRPTTTKIQDL